MYKILRRKQLNDTVVRLDVEAPFIAKKAKAGQFIILRIDERGERMPLTIADTNAEEGSVSIIFQIVGQTTMLLSQMNEGDCLLDFVGPLGAATEFGHIKKACVICCNEKSVTNFFIFIFKNNNILASETGDNININAHIK